MKKRRKKGPASVWIILEHGRNPDGQVYLKKSIAEEVVREADADPPDVIVRYDRAKS